MTREEKIQLIRAELSAGKFPLFVCTLFDDVVKRGEVTDIFLSMLLEEIQKEIVLLKEYD